MKAHRTAKVYRHPGSPYYQAWFMVWDGRRQAWKPKTQSTRCTDESRALGIAREFEKVALAAGGAKGDARVSREFVVRSINTIMEIAGQPIYEETRHWDEYSREWLELQSSRVKERSLESYESHVKQFTKWLEGQRNMRVDLITGRMMQTWYQDAIEEGRKPSTVNNTVKALQQIFDRARAEGFCPRNPAELILRQYGEKDTREPFSAEDITLILSHLRKHDELADWLTVSLLGLCTGQRLQDCALAAGEEFITKGDHKVWKCAQGKTERYATVVEVPLVEPLLAHITALKVRKGPLCPSLAGLPSGGPNGLSMAFSEILDAAGVVREKREKAEDSKGQSWTNKTFHSFRHTTNSLLANAGVSQDIRRKLLGHASEKVNTGYTHMETEVNAEALTKAIQRIIKA